MNWTQLSLQFVIGGAFAFAICYTVMLALIKVQREHIKELGSERDDYRSKLHQCRNDAEVTSLKLSELQSRPDLHDLGVIIGQNTKALTSLTEGLAARDVMFDRIEHAFQETASTLTVLSGLIRDRAAPVN